MIHMLQITKWGTEKYVYLENLNLVLIGLLLRLKHAIPLRLYSSKHIVSI